MDDLHDFPSLTIVSQHLIVHLDPSHPGPWRRPSSLRPYRPRQASGRPSAPPPRGRSADVLPRASRQSLCIDVSESSSQRGDSAGEPWLCLARGRADPDAGGAGGGFVAVLCLDTLMLESVSTAGASRGISLLVKAPVVMGGTSANWALAALGVISSVVRSSADDG